MKVRWFPGGSAVKNLPANAGDAGSIPESGRSPGGGNGGGSLEEEMATHSSIFVWKIPWTEEPGGLQFLDCKRVGHNCASHIMLFIHVHV